MKRKVQLVVEDEYGGITTTDLVDIERGADGLIGTGFDITEPIKSAIGRPSGESS